MIITTVKPKSVIVSLLLGVFFGPLSLFYFTFWGAILMLLLPVTAIFLVTHFYLDDQLLALARYPTSLIFWGGGYWMLSIICVLGLAYEHNLELGRKLPAVAEKQPVSPELKIWLRRNPGCTVNDYYREQIEKAVFHEAEYELQETW
jgi:hypothetical protein